MQKRRKILNNFLLLGLILGISFIALISFNYIIDNNDQKIVFSKDSGFYKESFYLELQTNGNNCIYYTLDGSTPNKNSIKYNQPILIENSSHNENKYSMIKDVSVTFYKDILSKYETIDKDPNYVIPDYLIDKCTIVRAIAIDENGVYSKEETRTYFVDLPYNRYDGCGIISLVTDPDNLFGYENGIYVTGKKFFDYLQKNEMNKYYRLWDANYKQKGKEWKKKAYINVFNDIGKNIYNGDVDISVHGVGSRALLPKSLNLYSIDSNNRRKPFEINFFNNNHYTESVTLFSGGSLPLTQFSDYMMAEKASNLNFAIIKNYEPYILFLDGEYWGFYWLQERFNKDYFSHYYDVNQENILMIKIENVEIGDDSDIYYYNDLCDFICNSDMSDDSNYKKLCEKIDIDSFTDYYATMIYIARNGDWPVNNTALWRTKVSDGSQYGDGKWRWILFDCNSSCMRDDKGLTQHDTLNYVIERDPIFSSIWNNDGFRKRFVARVLEIADCNFESDKMDEYIDDFSIKMKPILMKSWDRFYGSQNNKEEEFDTVMNSYKDFFRNRKIEIEKILEDNINQE